MIFNKQEKIMMPLIRSFVIANALWLLCAMGANAADHSIMARLATHSMVLDVAKANGRLVAVGERGHLLVSDDQGVNWTQKAVPTKTLLTNVFFLNDKTGWVVGHDQTILFTSDGGDSWQLQHVDQSDDMPLFDIWFADEKHGFAVGAYALYLTTDDGGQSWQSAFFDPAFGESAIENVEDDTEDLDDDYAYEEEEFPAFDYHLYRLAVADSGTLYLAAEAGYVFRSEDQGDSWKSLPSPYEGSFFGVTSLSEDEVLLYGLRGNLFRSEDAGQNWSQIETGTNALLGCGLQLKNGLVLVAGAGGTILVSEDDGRSFTSWRQKDGQTISSLYEMTPDRVVAGSTRGAKILDVAAFRSGNN